MYLIIICLPLLASIISGFFGRKIGIKGSQMITCICVIIATILAILSFLEVGLNNTPVSIYLFRWVDSESLNVLWKFNFDSLTVSMLIPVLIISSLVHIYSIGYMNNDPHNQRFFSYLSLFTFMMIILVTANNFLLMFVGWEGVGICSYLLVNFWFTRIAANQSSISAFLTNRVGDFLLTIGLFIIILTLGNIDYSSVFSLAPFINENIITIIGICLLIGAMAKSSQIGLHVWLPLAMEGPTPVSALIHAATMVTAGVYLLMRASPLIEYSSTVLILCLWIGSITTVFSSLIGLFQQDIKKVIAYSTMSQLGMMVVAVGLSCYNIALFHLINHAFYKGLLFLGAGAVIHSVYDNQDFRKYGGLILFLPLTYCVMLVASLSLIAFPYMTGFYSKDFIIESAFGQYQIYSIIAYFITLIGAIFTTLYSVKVLYLTFLTNANSSIINYKNIHEGDIFINLPLIILAIFSIFFGFIVKDIFIGLASAFFIDNSIFIHPLNETTLNTEFAVPIIFKLLPLFTTCIFFILYFIILVNYPKWFIIYKFTKLGYKLFNFFNQRFFIELLYNKYITNVILKLGSQTTKILDKGSVELLGPYGLEMLLFRLSKSLDALNTGIVTFYALYILVGLISYFIIPLIHPDILLILIINSFILIWLYHIDAFSKSRNKIEIIKSNLIISMYSSGNFNFFLILQICLSTLIIINNILISSTMNFMWEIDIIFSRHYYDLTDSFLNTVSGGLLNSNDTFYNSSNGIINYSNNYNYSDSDSGSSNDSNNSDNNNDPNLNNTSSGNNNNSDDVSGNLDKSSENKHKSKETYSLKNSSSDSYGDSSSNSSDNDNNNNNVNNFNNDNNKSTSTLCSVPDQLPEVEDSCATWDRHDIGDIYHCNYRDVLEKARAFYDQSQHYITNNNIDENSSAYQIQRYRNWERISETSLEELARKVKFENTGPGAHQFRKVEDLDTYPEMGASRLKSNCCACGESKSTYEIQYLCNYCSCTLHVHCYEQFKGIQPIDNIPHNGDYREHHPYYDPVTNQDYNYIPPNHPAAESAHGTGISNQASPSNETEDGSSNESGPFSDNPYNEAGPSSGRPFDEETAGVVKLVERIEEVEAVDARRSLSHFGQYTHPTFGEDNYDLEEQQRQQEKQGEPEEQEEQKGKGKQKELSEQQKQEQEKQDKINEWMFGFNNYDTD